MKELQSQEDRELPRWEVMIGKLILNQTVARLRATGGGGGGSMVCKSAVHVTTMVGGFGKFIGVINNRGFMTSNSG